MAEYRARDYWEDDHDQPSDGKAVYVGRRRNGFAGIVIGIPLSIFSWVGIFSLTYAAQKIIF